jgi:hypothetical protein
MSPENIAGLLTLREEAPLRAQPALGLRRRRAEGPPGGGGGPALGRDGRCHDAVPAQPADTQRRLRHGEALRRGLRAASALFSFFLNGDTTSFDAIRCFPGGSRKPARNAPDQCEDPYSVILNPWEASVLDDPCMLYAPKSTKVSVKKYYDTLLILL